MAKYFNITGASSAAAELTQELVALDDDLKVNKIFLTNVHDTNMCTVDLYIEKPNIGKFYLVKRLELPVGATYLYDFDVVNASINGFGLYIKLTKSAAETPSVDVILK